MYPLFIKSVPPQSAHTLYNKIYINLLNIATARKRVISLNSKDKMFELFQKREYPVVEDNKLAQQKYISKKSRGTSPTLTEEKALAYIISKIKPLATDIGPIEYDIKEFCEICGFNEIQPNQ